MYPSTIESRTPGTRYPIAGVAAWAVPYGYNGGEPIETAAPERIFPGLQQLAEHVLEDA